MRSSIQHQTTMFDWTRNRQMSAYVYYNTLHFISQTFNLSKDNKAELCFEKVRSRFND